MNDEVIEQLSILIYNQPEVQNALTAVTRSYRTRSGLTEAGVEMVTAVVRTAMTFTQSPDALAAAFAAAPRTAEAAAFAPGIYPAVAVGEGDLILHGGVEVQVQKVMAGRDEVQLTILKGGEPHVISLQPETQVHVTSTPYAGD